MIEEITEKKYINVINFLVNNLFSIKFENEEKIPLCSQLSLCNDNLVKIERFNYKYYVRDLITYKRGVLFFFKNKFNENKTVLIDENFKFYEINFETMDEYYKGTTIEILYNLNNFILVDSYSVYGKNTMKYKFSERQLELDFLIHNIITPTEIDLSLVKVNDWNKINNMDNNEELIIIPEDLPIKFGLNYSYFTWKKAEYITINLTVKENNENLDLYTTNFKEFKLFATINSSSEDIPKIKNLENYKNNCTLEFSICEPKLKAIRVLDKKYPSNIRIIERAVVNKLENIQLNQII